jgi:aspartyl-tRNA(Asn)/glutamyl-tRNA(Gln) amidotransferase subunit B
MSTDKYEAVIGLELHVQLNTRSKIYSGDSASYGGLPNTQINPISLGHPGTLPKVNKEVVESAVKLGLACGSKITKNNQFARKNYFYADLPKGYQITQDKTPICTGGHVLIKDGEGKDKKVTLTRIHMEEDSGKSIHDQDPFNTLIDLNRAGIGLLEIVSEPELRTGEEAYNYVTEVRKIVRYLDICDGNMEEGSLRCDANISVRLKGETKFGQRTEVKNMNSMRNVQRAIQYEIKRQIEEVERGGTIYMETRNFDAVRGTTHTMRSKEQAHDYRYFPEPDLQPILLHQDYIAKVESTLPELPIVLYQKYVEQFDLSDYDASIIVENKAVALYFESFIKHTTNYKSAANWLIGPIKSYLNENAVEMENFPICAAHMALLVELIDGGKINTSLATQQLFPLMLEEPEKEPLVLAQKHDLIQDSNTSSIEQYVLEVLQNHPNELKRYRGGSKNLFGFFMGELMKLSSGKADPKVANQLLRQHLEQK